MTDRSFDLAAVAVAQAAMKDESPARPDLQLLERGLQRFIGSLFAQLTEWEAAETASDTISSFWDAARRNLVDMDDNPAAYITAMARKAALNILRSTPRETKIEDDEPGLEDVDLDGVLDKDTAFSQLDRIRSKAIENADHIAVQVITVWLDLANEEGRSPSSREVAAHAGMSHASVNRALARLRALIDERAEG